MQKDMALGGALFELESIKACPPDAQAGWWSMEWWWNQPNVPETVKFVSDYRAATKKTPSARRSIMGLTPPREGSVNLFGIEATRMPAYKVAALGVGYVPGGRKIFANLTVEDNLRVPLMRPGVWTTKRIFETFPRLAERRDNRGRQLSGGEQEMLSIARALLLNPKLLLLDEPSQGLAPLIVKEVFQIIQTMRKEGMAVLLVE
jgi:ABC-type branched-subunit amino acid transport system ATPase component